jgi:hypothetical protein
VGLLDMISRIGTAANVFKGADVVFIHTGGLFGWCVALVFARWLHESAIQVHSRKAFAACKKTAVELRDDVR